MCLVYCFAAAASLVAYYVTPLNLSTHARAAMESYVLIGFGPRLEKLPDSCQLLRPLVDCLKRNTINNGMYVSAAAR